MIVESRIIKLIYFLDLVSIIDSLLISNSRILAFYLYYDDKIGKIQVAMETFCVV